MTDKKKKNAEKMPGWTWWIIIAIALTAGILTTIGTHEKKPAPPAPVSSCPIPTAPTECPTEWVMASVNGENIRGKVKRTETEFLFTSPTEIIEAYSMDGKVYEGENIYFRVIASCSSSVALGWKEEGGKKIIFGLTGVRKPPSDPLSGEWISFWEKFPGHKGKTAQKCGYSKGKILKKPGGGFVYKYQCRGDNGIEDMKPIGGNIFEGRWKDFHGNGKTHWKFILPTMAIGWWNDYGKGEKIPAIFFRK